MLNFILSSELTALEKIKNCFSGTNLIWTIIDILFVTVLLYVLFSFLKRKNCTRLIKYIVVFILLAVVLGSNLNQTHGLKMMGYLASTVLVIAIVAVVVLFTQEIKRTLWKISSPKDESEFFQTDYGCTEDELHEAIGDIVKAVQNMAKKNIGALIVIAPTSIPSNIIRSGTELDSKISSPLLECIFNTSTPLHDGATFVRGNTIVAAGCFLPLTQSLEVDRELGTRHRAAIGITETNNVMAIIVSEETGVISVAIDGILTRYYDSEMLRTKLEEVYGLKATKSEKKHGAWRKRI
ncbi:MAG: diadenylate cyclase CdaA [Clostridia bacterium]|nr:diadenylate cyclase CdaA [Clostridia bacterium]